MALTRSTLGSKREVRNRVVKEVDIKVNRNVRHVPWTLRGVPTYLGTIYCSLGTQVCEARGSPVRCLPTESSITLASDSAGRLGVLQIKTFSYCWVVVVVQQPACLPSTPTIQFQLKSTLFSSSLFEKTNINLYESGVCPFNNFPIPSFWKRSDLLISSVESVSKQLQT